MLVLPGVAVVCYSEGAIEKFRGKSMVLIEVEFPNADVFVDCRFRVVFLVASLFVAGCGGGVVFISCRFGDDALFPKLKTTIRRLTRPLLIFSSRPRLRVSCLWFVWVWVFRRSFFPFATLPFCSQLLRLFCFNVPSGTAFLVVLNSHLFGKISCCGALDCSMSKNVSMALFS